MNCVREHRLKRKILFFTLIAIICNGSLLSHADAANPPSRLSIETQKYPAQNVTLLIFESRNCKTDCEAIDFRLQTIQKESLQEPLAIHHYFSEYPDDQQAFLQNQVTQLPDYILVGENHQVLMEMTGTIQPDQLFWQIKEALAENPKLQVPKAFEKAIAAASENKMPLILLFWSWDDPHGQALSEYVTGHENMLFDKMPTVLSFNAQQPNVQAWMKQLGFSHGPAYLVVTPQGSVFRKSIADAQPWQLGEDLMAYTNMINQQPETILVRLSQPVPAERYILPATMTPQSKPSSGEMSHP